MPAKQESPQCIVSVRPREAGVTSRKSKTLSPSGLLQRSPTQQNSENLSPAWGLKVGLSRESISMHGEPSTLTGQRARSPPRPPRAATLPHLCSLCSTMRQLWHVSTSQVSQNSLRTSCVCRGQYKAKSPEPPFTPAREDGESGHVLLRKTSSKLSSTEHPQPSMDTGKTQS